MNINLTKWLSRCECSFHKGKRKPQLIGDDDDKIMQNHIRKQEQEAQNRINIWKLLKDKEDTNM